MGLDKRRSPVSRWAWLGGSSAKSHPIGAANRLAKVQPCISASRYRPAARPVLRLITKRWTGLALCAFGLDADPVRSLRRNPQAYPFRISNGPMKKPSALQGRRSEPRIDLQHRLAAGQTTRKGIPARHPFFGPHRADRGRLLKRPRLHRPSPNKLRVRKKFADRGGAIPFQRTEIAIPGEAANTRRRPGMHGLRPAGSGNNFFDRIAPISVALPCRGRLCQPLSKPFCRKRPACRRDHKQNYRVGS